MDAWRGGAGEKRDVRDATQDCLEGLLGTFLRDDCFLSSLSLSLIGVAFSFFRGSGFVALCRGERSLFKEGSSSLKMRYVKFADHVRT